MDRGGGWGARSGGSKGLLGGGGRGVPKALMDVFSYKGEKKWKCSPFLRVFPLVTPLMQPVHCSCCETVLIR